MLGTDAGTAGTDDADTVSIAPVYPIRMLYAVREDHVLNTRRHDPMLPVIFIPHT